MSSDTVVDVLDHAETQAAIRFNLDRAGCTWEELQEQARAGQFTSEKAHRAWFIVSSFVEAG